MRRLWWAWSASELFSKIVCIYLQTVTARALLEERRINFPSRDRQGAGVREQVKRVVTAKDSLFF